MHKTMSPVNNKVFSKNYYWFRVITIICIGYWVTLLLMLLLPHQYELADTYSLFLYAAFLITHFFILASIYISEKLQMQKKALIYVAIFPTAISIIAIIISIASYSSVVITKLING
jgi:4-hydroxybenzoate polyprenyltransferase